MCLTSPEKIILPERVRTCDLSFGNEGGSPFNQKLFLIKF
jgi:hypothetical protein